MFCCRCVSHCLCAVSTVPMHIDQCSTRWSFFYCILYCSKNRNAHFLAVLFRASSGAVFQHDNARPHAAHHTTQFLTNSITQILPCLPCPPFEHNKTHNLGRVGQMCLMQSECHCKHVSCSRHSSRNGWPS